MAVPAVYAAIRSVGAELAKIGIAKTRTNPIDEYRYRSIDDLVGALSPLLAKYRMCVLPQVLERTAVERRGVDDSILLNVTLRVAFDLVSARDGTKHRVEAFGEALDPSDKATAKAMSAAYKSAMLQTFCIPVPAEDGDANSHKMKVVPQVIEPVQGWGQWALDISDIVGVCETIAAVDLVQDRNHPLLIALGRERPDLYAELGGAFTSRRETLQGGYLKSKARKAGRRVAAARPERELENG